jgi:hypothetical protein
MKLRIRFLDNPFISGLFEKTAREVINSNIEF